MRFGGEHQVLDVRGVADVEALELPPSRSGLRAGPEASVRQTAEVLERPFDVDPALATLDVGAWRGRTPEQIPGTELALWFSDPAAAPHGGETVRAFVSRIRRHVEAMYDDAHRSGDVILVVAKPVAQALLCDGPDGFFRVDLRPGSILRHEDWSRR